MAFSAASTMAGPSKRPRAAQPPSILLLFRTTDLRLHDNHALAAAVAESARHIAIVPVFVWSRCDDGHNWGVHGACEVYLKQALVELDASLTRLGSRLIFRHCDQDGQGDPHHPTATNDSSPFADAVVALAAEANAKTVHYNVEHTPEALARDAAMQEAIHARLPDLRTTAHLSQLLYAPDVVALEGGFNGGHWGTLMPFLRACEKSGQPARCLPAPTASDLVSPNAEAGGLWPTSCGIDGLRLAVMPASSNWGAAIIDAWPAGERHAQHACVEFVATGMLRYERDRSRADLFSDEDTGTKSKSSSATSRLSIALRFGELSPRFLYWAIHDAALPRDVTKTFGRRLHWRDLAYYQLSVFPQMRSRSIRAHYDSTQWVRPQAEYQRRLTAWQRGMTGYPMVDAGMRELYLTGWMSQSVRMVCASFLVEYLRVSWVDGELWFGDTLCDADSAINAMMWQNAGRSGIDQWNFVMSPDAASQDPTGKYTRKYVPELAKLPNKLLHRPWLASAEELVEAGVELGGGAGCYPNRVVADLRAEREASVKAVLDLRREHQQHNDARGYDLIMLPDGTKTKVFTKEQYRISKAGTVLPRPPRRNGKGGTSSRSRGRIDTPCGVKAKSGGSARGPRGRAKGQRSVTEFLVKRSSATTSK